MVYILDKTVQGIFEAQHLVMQDVPMTNFNVFRSLDIDLHNKISSDHLSCVDVVGCHVPLSWISYMKSIRRARCNIKHKTLLNFNHPVSLAFTANWCFCITMHCSKSFTVSTNTMLCVLWYSPIWFSPNKALFSQPNSSSLASITCQWNFILPKFFPSSFTLSACNLMLIHNRNGAPSECFFKRYCDFCQDFLVTSSLEYLAATLKNN
mmetsp:Transcript_19051/g.24597  ORF Transcript_19051/g.24597 Transcript_19051/m.24597 type:complete len:208 (-) Transcript_19051:234-857(-)